MLLYRAALFGLEIQLESPQRSGLRGSTLLPSVHLPYTSQTQMEVVELSILNAAQAADFEIQHLVGMGQNGMVVAASCSCRGLPNPGKLYAVKLLFNFTHEYSSVLRNTYENEWLVLSRLLPHENIVRFWAQFISVIPSSFADHLPPNIKQHTTHKGRGGEVVRRKGQFLVLDYHPQDLHTWISKLPCPLPFEKTLHVTEQLLEAVLYLEKNLIRHLDLKLSNLLMAEDNRLVLCDFGCAVQFTDDSFTLRYARGMLPGGNRAHLAPEVLNMHHRCRLDPSREGILNYSRQASFAVGVLVYEIATGEHALTDYPLGHTSNGVVGYLSHAMASLPACYPRSFCSIVQDLLHANPDKRLSVVEALKQLRVCCVRQQSGPSLSSVQVELESVRQERDIAKAKLSVVATERDFAVSEMRQMAEQCQSVAAEFESMANHCEHLMRELEQARKERDSAMKASESAYEASEMLREQLTLVTREKDLASTQLEELREITMRCQLEESIRECWRCHRFYLDSENINGTCHWHPGVRVGWIDCSSSYY